MKILMVTALYSGLRESVESGKWCPTGVPAIYKLVEALGREKHQVQWVLLGTETSPATMFDDTTKIKMDELNIDLFVMPYKGDSFSRFTKFLPKKISRRLTTMYNDAVQYYKVWTHFVRLSWADIYYTDRRNVLLAAIVALSGHRVVVRFLGVADLYRLGQNFFQILNRPLYLLALKAPFDLVISSEDGSPAQWFLEDRLSRKVAYRILVNGVDRPKANYSAKLTLREELGFHKSYPMLLYVGRMEENKGAEEFLEALIRLDSANIKFYAVMVTGGTDFTEAESKIREVSLDERIAFRSFVPHSDLVSYYGETEIYVSTDKWANLTNTVLEALIGGSCVLILGSDPVSHVGESGEALIPENVAMRVPRSRPVSGLVDCLTHLISEPEEIGLRGEKAICFAEEYLWTWEARIGYEIKLLNAIAAGQLLDDGRCIPQQTAARSSRLRRK